MFCLKNYSICYDFLWHCMPKYWEKWSLNHVSSTLHSWNHLAFANTPSFLHYLPRVSGAFLSGSRFHRERRLSLKCSAISSGEVKKKRSQLYSTEMHKSMHSFQMHLLDMNCDRITKTQAIYCTEGKMEDLNT